MRDTGVSLIFQPAAIYCYYSSSTYACLVIMLHLLRVHCSYVCCLVGHTPSESMQCLVRRAARHSLYFQNMPAALFVILRDMHWRRYLHAIGGKTSAWCASASPLRPHSHDAVVNVSRRAAQTFCVYFVKYCIRTLPLWKSTLYPNGGGIRTFVAFGTHMLSREALAELCMFRAHELFGSHAFCDST